MVGPGQKQTLNQVVSTFDNKFSQFFSFYFPPCFEWWFVSFLYSGIQLQELQIKTFTVSLQLFSFFLSNLIIVINSCIADIQSLFIKNNFQARG